MLNNSLTRSISSVLLGGTIVFLLIKFNYFYKILFSILLVFMLIEWFNINKNKNTLLFYCGILYISFPILYLIKSQFFHSASILFLFSIVWSCDTFAYIGGKLIGGPKFSPKISPNKTWSGVICGCVISFIVSFVYVKYVWPVWHESRLILWFIPLFVISSILGDLIESKVKRILGVKDTGNIIPGHGGVLDRFDSFLLTTYIYIIYIWIN